METVKMSWEEWVEKFKPVKNHINPSAPEDGCMFETYGEEFAYVQGHASENKVWTLYDDGDVSFVENGIHVVNRLGYFVTEVPYLPETAYVVDESECEGEELPEIGTDNPKVLTAEGTIVYARTVILERILTVQLEPGQDPHAALMDEAHRLENTQELGLESWQPKDGSEVKDIVDDENIWELEDVVVNEPEPEK